MVDLVVADTRGRRHRHRPGRARPVPAGLCPYAATGDEAFPDGDVAPAYAGDHERPDRARPAAACAAARTPGTRSSARAASRSAWPARRPPGCSRSTWCRGSCRPRTGTQLQAGLVQRVRALDAFLHDVYGDRVGGQGRRRARLGDRRLARAAAQRRAGRPARRARPGGRRRPGPRRRRQLVRAGGQPAGAVRHRVRRCRTAGSPRPCCPSCPRPDGLLDVEGTPALLRAGAARRGRPPAAGDDPPIVVLSQGPDDSAWFEHRMLAEEMGVPLVRSTELLVDDGRVFRLRDGTRHRGRRDLPADGRGQPGALPRRGRHAARAEPGRRRCTRTPSRWPTRSATASATTRRSTPTCPS